MVREGFQSRGVRPVTVYLLRDPVERVWSAARMDMRRRGADAPEAPETRIGHMYMHPMYADRTRYDLTMDALEAAFPRESVWYGFYERFFSVETLAPLCEFLGIAFHEPDFGRQVNVSPKPRGPLCPRTPSARSPTTSRRSTTRSSAASPSWTWPRCGRRRGCSDALPQRRAHPGSSPRRTFPVSVRGRSGSWCQVLGRLGGASRSRTSASSSSAVALPT